MASHSCRLGRLRPETSIYVERFALREGRGVRPRPVGPDADAACSEISFKKAESES